MNNAPLIEISDLRKYFYRGDERIQALGGASVAIAEGEFVSITGPSGSGKSTLLYLLGLLDSPSSGSYKLRGIETSTLSDNDRADLRNETLGFVFQSFHLLPRYTALENVGLPLQYSRKGPELSQVEIKNRAIDVLTRVNLGERIDHYPNQLSGGQRQRVAIARALVGNPSLILADEPTGNLDSKSANDVLETLVGLNKSGKTILLVTHDNEIAARAARQISIKDGLVERDEKRGGVS